MTTSTTQPPPGTGPARSPIRAAMEWSQAEAHLLKAKLGLERCMPLTGRHDRMCDALSSGIAAVIVGYGIPLPSSPQGESDTRGKP